MGLFWFLTGFSTGFYYFVPKNVKTSLYYGTVFFGGLLLSKLKVSLWKTKFSLKDW